MSWKQTKIDKSSVFGAGSISRVILPYIVSGIRRSDPDMTSTNAYYPSLNGKTIILEQGGDYSATTTITFTSDAYYIAINTINGTSPAHIKAADYDGYLGFVSQHAGGNNYLKVTGGTALSILGIDTYPHPAGISYAGEIDSPKPSTYEGRTKGTGVILKNEGVNRENWNRGLAAIGYVLDTFSANLDREIAFPVQYTTTINGSSFSIASDDRLYIQGSGISSAGPSVDTLDKIITVVDTNNNLLFDSNGDRVRVTSVTYGTLVDASTSFSSWGASDGKSVFGNSAHTQKIKTTGTITSINGNTIRCSGATFVSSKVQANDTLKVSSATNLSPFSHNGEFVVDTVLSEEVLQVRPKGLTEGILTSGNTPTCLNQVKALGESYGSVTIYVGKFLPLALPAANMVFNLSATLPNTSYKVILPIGRTLKDLLQEDITGSTIVNPNGGQLEVGSKLIFTLANALKPRIISHPNGDTSKTLFAEFKNGTIGTRIYTLLAGGIELVYNGKWNGTSYVQEDMTKDTVIMKEDVVSIFLGTSNISLTIDWVNKTAFLGTSSNQFNVTDSTGILKAKVGTSFSVNDGTLDVATIPKFDGTSASQSILKAGIKLGTGFSTDNQHLIEKLNFTCNTTTNKYTLISETTLSAARRRDYTVADGSSIITINAKWDGTQWIKDSSTASSKLVLNPFSFGVGDGDNLKLYSHHLTTTPFSDTSWTNKEEIRNYQLNEDFLSPIAPVSDTAGKTVGPFFVVVSTTNTVVYSSVLSPTLGTFGEAAFQSDVSTGAFACLVQANPVYFGTGDFEMKIKVNVVRVNTLSAIDTGLVNGLIVGHSTGGADNLSFKVSGGGTWHYQIGTNLIDTTISATGLCLLTISRINGIANAFVNDTQVDTRAFGVSLAVTPTLSMKGTSTGASQDIFSADFFKLWGAGTKK